MEQFHILESWPQGHLPSGQRYQLPLRDDGHAIKLPDGCPTLGLEQWGRWKERWRLRLRGPGRPPVITWEGQALERKDEIGQRSGESLADRRNSQKIKELNTVEKPAALEPCVGGSRDSTSSSGRSHRGSSVGLAGRQGQLPNSSCLCCKWGRLAN